MAKKEEAAGRPNPVEMLRTEIQAVAAKATTADMTLVEELIAKARLGKRDLGIFVLSPVVLALLWLRHNPHNRDTRVSWVREIARRMATGQWQWNNEAMGFYTTGNMGDAGHRCAGGAIAGYTWEVPIVFGIDQGAITSIDDGKNRHAHEASKLTGMQLASVKERVLRQSFAYLKKWKPDIELPAIGSVAEMHNALGKHDGMLQTAIEVADRAFRTPNPILKKPIAQSAAFLMLWGHTPEAVAEKELLRLNEANTSTVGPEDPSFVAAEAIISSRKKADPKDRLSSNREIGLVLAAIKMSESGVKATRKSQLLASVKKELPDPTYHEPMAEAAE